MKNLRYFLWFLIILMFCFSCSKVNGFIEENGDTYYYVDGEMQTGWQFINDNWYYFSKYEYDEPEHKIGSMWIGSLYDDDGKHYVLRQDGTMVKGWYRFSEDTNEWFYFDMETGEGVIGWKELNGDLYNFSKNGKLNFSQWIDNKYYVDENGKMLRNTSKVIEGKNYSFDEKGNIIVYQPKQNTTKTNLPIKTRIENAQFENEQIKNWLLKIIEDKDHYVQNGFGSIWKNEILPGYEENLLQAIQLSILQANIGCDEYINDVKLAKQFTKELGLSIYYKFR